MITSIDAPSFSRLGGIKPKAQPRQRLGFFLFYLPNVACFVGLVTDQNPYYVFFLGLFPLPLGQTG